MDGSNRLVTRGVKLKQVKEQTEEAVEKLVKAEAGASVCMIPNHTDHNLKRRLH